MLKETRRMLMAATVIVAVLFVAMTALAVMSYRHTDLAGNCWDSWHALDNSWFNGCENREGSVRSTIVESMWTIWGRPTNGISDEITVRVDADHDGILDDRDCDSTTSYADHRDLNIGYGCEHGMAALPKVEVCNFLDDDHDGIVDNGFDLQNDPRNCGGCGHTCTDDAVCMMGACVARPHPNY